MAHESAVRGVLWVPFVLVVLTGVAGAGEPDLSTPERAYRAFLQIDLEFRREVRTFLILGVVDLHRELLAPLGTSQYLEDLEGRRRKAERALEEGILSVEVEFDGVEREEDGVARVLLRRIYRRRKRVDEGGVKEVRVEVPERIVYGIEGQGWRIRDRWIDCPTCTGPSVDAVSPCLDCAGKGFRKDRFGRFPAIPRPVADRPPPEPDRSDPASVARAYLARSQDVYGLVLRGIDRRIEEGIAAYRPFYSEAWIDQVRAERVRLASEGTRRSAGGAARLDRLEREDRRAQAYLVVERPTFEGAVTERLRLGLVEGEEGGWYVEHEDQACPRCEGQGECPRCVESDPEGRARCGFCQGTGRCRTCLGAGYLRGS